MGIWLFGNFLFFANGVHRTKLLKRNNGLLKNVGVHSEIVRVVGSGGAAWCTGPK